MSLSLSGDEVVVQSLPTPLQRAYLQSLDLEVGFLKQRQEIAEQFSADEMARSFVKAHKDMVFGLGEILVFDFHGQNLKAKVTDLSIVELPQALATQKLGILMDKTDLSFIKANDSLLKLKTSSRKCVRIYICILIR